MPASASQKKSARTPDKKKRQSPVVDPDDGSNNEGSEEQSGEEPEYEIERIITAKKGVYHKSRWAFLVAWKGYKEADNSWVDEPDFFAKELINQFWESNPDFPGNPKVSKKPRKSEMSTVKSSSRVSTGKVRKTNIEVSSSEEPAQKSTKRKQQPKEETDEDEDVEMEEAKPAAKKPRKLKDKAERSTSPQQENGARSEELDGEAVFEQSGHDTKAMNKHMGLKNWDKIIAQIDTVEGDGDQLLVYFTTTDGVKAITPSSILGVKAPQTLLKFYESHLRWRQGLDETAQSVEGAEKTE